MALKLLESELIQQVTKLKEALLTNNMDYIINEAITQEEVGADFYGKDGRESFSIADSACQ